MKNSLKLLLASSVLSVSVALPSVAQDDEIIVTATKRPESVQDIPIAVTVVSPAQLENQGVASIKDLSSVASGFNIQSSQTETQGTSIRIRGVGTTGNNIGLESSVGVFIDGVYQSRPGVALGELTDIEALELLRGPQGTLFGRNTSAGALNIRTNKPNFDGTSGYADFTYGNYDLINLKGGINMTASDTLAFRVNGAARYRDGFMTSTIDPNAESHNKNRFLIKGQALWEPSDDTSVRIIADYSEIDEDCCAAVTLTTSPNLGAAAAALFPAVGFDAGLEEQLFNDQQWRNGSDSFGVSAELNQGLGDIDMTLIGSYRDYGAFSEQQDFNGSLQYSVPALSDDIETLTAELRFQGTAMDDRLDWLVGGYYANETIDENFTLRLGPDYSSSVSLANFGSPAILGLVSAGGAFFASGQNPAAFVPISSDGAFAENLFHQDAQTFSIFTHNIFSVSEDLDLTVGVRYNDDTKDASFMQPAASNDACLAGFQLAGAVGADPAGAAAALSIFGPVVAGTLTNPAALNGGVFLNCFPFAAPALGVSFLPATFDESFSDSELIYTIKADYQLDDNVLLYGGFSHGYKAGGFNLDATAAAGGASPQFASEEIDSWELGIKTTLTDGVRFNLTGFHSSMDNFQVLEFTGTQFQTFNVDDVSSKGVEAELYADLSDDWSINAGVTYADAGYGSECDRGGTIGPAVTLCNFSLTNAPEFTSVFGVTYDGQLGDSGWGVLANVNAQQSSSRRTSTQPQTAVGVLNPLDVQDGYVKFNARLGFTMPNEQVSIEFWGLNLTDEITRAITFNTPLQGASRSAFIEAPRQYGVTVRTDF